LDAEKFDAIPLVPEKLLKHAVEACFVSYEDGVVASFPGLEDVKNMPSFKKLMMNSHPGDTIRKTVDYFTTPGSAMLVHEDADILKKDYLAIRNLESPGGGLYKLA
jgi:hypothetical protein